MEIGNRRIKYEDGKFYVRSVKNGKETKKELWKEMKFGRNYQGYLRYRMMIGDKYTNLLYHRILYKFHHLDWNILDVSLNNLIDHKNGNPQDNRIENLRLVTNQENGFNRTTARGYNITPAGNYKSQICVNKKFIYLGTYKTEDEAREAYLRGKEKYHVIQSR